MSRRERAWHTLEAELGAPIRRTSDLGGIWGSAFDAYEGELGDDLESEEMVRRAALVMAEAYWHGSADGAARSTAVDPGWCDAMRAALRSVLEDSV